MRILLVLVFLISAFGCSSPQEAPVPTDTLTVVIATDEATEPASEAETEATAEATAEGEATVEATEPAEDTAAATEEATAEATEATENTTAATEEATEEAGEEATAEATEDTTAATTEEASTDSTEETTAVATEESTEGSTETTNSTGTFVDTEWTCPEGFEGQTLSLFNWATYIGDNTVSDFEKLCGVSVQYDVYESDEALIARLRQGNPGYDLAFPTDYAVAIMARDGLVGEIDLDNIPNVANIDERYLKPYFDV